MQENNTVLAPNETPTSKTDAKQNPAENIKTQKETGIAKEEVKEEVKQSFKDPDAPVEPALGDDGIEVGGEG